jgi:hypothetical protein
MDFFSTIVVVSGRVRVAAVAELREDLSLAWGDGLLNYGDTPPTLAIQLLPCERVLSKSRSMVARL